MGQIGPRAVRCIYIYMPVCVYKWSCGLRGSRGPKKIIMDGVSLPSRKGEKVVIENYEKEWIWAVQVQLDFYPSPTGASLDRVWLWLKKIVTTNLDCLGPLQLQPDNDVQHNFLLKARHKNMIRNCQCVMKNYFLTAWRTKSGAALNFYSRKDNLQASSR